ncbi:hypothetical protein [Salipiger mucosus]|uniref:Glucose/Sorbosone dehydrogenase domain-containing protein n=1 Tax=Salipiger mucosus DSM 16094 TaxID=1123237 RepID=S9QXG2_9RHOB|nr:hypothetical protein [Salipiger mucosus]EPX86041.1 hypothetical protein Salmuc_00858 [Salipiger mucosus DSM 16094]
MQCFAPRPALSLLALAAALGVSNPAVASTLQPAPVLNSTLTVEVSHVGNVRGEGGSSNIAEPVAVGDDLYVVDQGARTISIAGSDGMRSVLDESSLPAGVSLEGGTGIVNIAGEGDRVYVGMYSSTLPTGFDTPAALPDDPSYSTGQPRFDLVYAYDRAADGSLVNPVPVTAFEATTGGHRGGGMLVLPNGDLLYARGDNLSQHYDGLSAPQDPGSTLSKLLVIDGETGAVEVAAMGIRNVQHMTYADDTRERIVFSDIGWTVAEEINAIAVSDLTDTATVENFGWGRNADGFAREGSFYVSEGPESEAEVVGIAPPGEVGFHQPFAQFGREDRDDFFAVSGPVTSASSFSDIGMLFGNLVEGDLYATLAGAEGTLNDVYSVALVDGTGAETTLQALLGRSRIDLRFFNFADGSAGLMSERSGDIFRLSEIIVPVPLPAGGVLLLGALAGLLGTRRRARRAQVAP